jgi:hypothetical protein
VERPRIEELAPTGRAIVEVDVHDALDEDRPAA